MEISYKDVHETYNARYLSPQKVAETFVFTDDFEILSKQYNIILMGHRGSGKTTLLKMLTAEALQSWTPRNLREKQIKESINYISVFIPADLLWKDQIDQIQKKLENYLEFKTIVIDTIIKANILNAFINCISTYTRINFNSKKDIEFQISEKLIKNWRLSDDRAYTFDDVKEAINEKTRDLDIIIGHATLFNYSYDECMEEFKKLSNSDFYFLNVSDLLNEGCTTYEKYLNKSRPFKWALCFDELELVPKSLLEDLISQLRNSPQRFIFKLSVAPIIEYSQSTIHHQPLEGHDFTAIRLWPYGQNHANIKDFSKALILNRLNIFLTTKYGHQEHLDQSMLKDIFKQTDFFYSLKDFDFIEKNSINRDAEVGEKYSLTWYTFKRLAQQDKTFISYLEDKHIDPENPVARVNQQKDEIFRKVKEIVINRLIFTKLGFRNQKRRYRTRKRIPLYYGTTTIYNICEGNPRWTLRLLESMFMNLKINDRIPHVSERNQVQSIMETSDQFYSFIYSFSTVCKIKGITWRLHTLIDKLGYFASKEINIADFKPNPCTSFIIDSNIPLQILSLVKLAINIGALIVIDSPNSFLSTEVINERVRLHYLLAPIYKLPLRQYGSISMSRVLFNDEEGKVKQPELSF